MYIIIWEFQTKVGREAEFEQLYGPEGEWVQLFRQGEGYLGSELLRDTAQPRRYLILDRWDSAAAYETFRSRWVDAYKALDAQGERLTAREAWVGSMVEVR
jgi:heme-degrading monooxygenase HmoA